MNRSSVATDFSQLRYGFDAKIFKNQIFSPVTIYIDNLYDNFLWISTDDSSFLVDLCYTNINAYSLELQLAIKHQSGYKGQKLPRYILLKQLNTEIPIIFNQTQTIQYSSQQDLGSFINGKKPSLYHLVDKFIQQKKKNITYSANFSRIFKKLRLAMQGFDRSKTTQFNTNQLLNLFDTLEILKPIDSNYKKQSIQKNKTFNNFQILNILKILYCRLNLKLLKSLSQTTSETINKFKRPQQFISSSSIKIEKLNYTYGQKYITCFEALTLLQNLEQNYLIPQHKPSQNLCLTDYFCFSSHNTYLTGNQLTSDSKVTRYIEDLKKGIKCVQLDVHNQGGNQPIITHAISGKGFCKPISFRTTIQAIDQFLEYHPKHYPIILSIENHASRQNQDLMNNILIKQFPRCILTPLGKDEFPKLQDCKGKIIVKTSCDLQTLAQFKNNEEAPKTSKLYKAYSKELQNFEQDTIKHGSQLQFSRKNQNSLFLRQVQQNNQYNNIAIDQQFPDYVNFLSRIKKIKKLKQLFNQKIDQTSYLPVQKIVQITSMFKAPQGIQTKNPSSFQCTSMINHKIVKAPKQKIINYTKQAWLRSYPEGSEIKSANYNFMELLARGVQIIALNTQTNDDYAIMMNSYFRAGQTRSMQTIGYIQKPVYLRRSTFQTKQLQPYPYPREYVFTFYTYLNLQFTLQSIDNASIQVVNNSDQKKQIKFKVSNYNQSFLIIRIDNKKYIQCIPLRFLPYVKSQNKTIFRTIIGRDYQFEDTGIRILTGFYYRNVTGNSSVMRN